MVKSLLYGKRNMNNFIKTNVKKTIYIFFLISFFTFTFAESKTVKVGWYIQSKYQELSTSGTPFGYNYYYLQKIAEYTNWNYEYIFDSFDNCMHMLEDGEIDILGCIISSPERAMKLNFPEIPVGISYRYLYTNYNDDLNFEDFKTTEGYKIGVLSNSINIDAFNNFGMQNNFKNQYLVGCDNTQIMEYLLQDKDIDAVLSGSLPDINKYKILAEFSPQSFYFALAKNRSDLLEEINIALTSINYELPFYQNDLINKYEVKYKNPEVFSPAEMKFIESLEPINVAWSPVWAPLEIEDKTTKTFQGYVRDIFDEISKISGLKFNYIKCKNTEEALSLILADKVDIISMYTGNDISAKQNNLFTTTPIISLPIQIIKKNNNSKNPDKVGVIHNEKTYSALLGISEYNLVRYPTVEDALNAVKKEEISFLITNSYAAHYYLQNHKYSTLYGVSLQETPIDIRIGVSNKFSDELITIFNKSLETIPVSTQNALLIQSTISTIQKEIDDIIDIIDLIPSPVILVIIVMILIFFIIVSILLTKKIQHSQILQNQLFTDNLTGLLSKDGFDWLLAKKLEKHPHESYCIISFDMEHFEHYNALFGFAAGDELLKNIGKICISFCPKDELCVHLNSDHFVLFANEKELSAEERIEQLRNSIKNLNKSYRIFLNFGVYRLSTGLTEPAQMRDYSKAALRLIKSNSTKYIGYYDQDLHSQLIKESIMSSEMEEALTNHEFVAYFQPKYDCFSEQPVGAEALVRWKKKDNTIVSPGIFIPLFEKNGLIIKLDMYVFEESCKVIASQIAQGIKPVPISTNFSRVHMYNHYFAKNLAEIAGKYNVPPHLLEIEITESAFSANPKLLFTLIESLHGYGFLVSIDDFGSGYSSLNLIKEMRFDVIKIDQVFFKNNHETERTKSVVQCILSLAKELGMRTVAEGVETEEQYNFLKKSECDTIQGFYFSKPLEETIFTQLLASNGSADI